MAICITFGTHEFTSMLEGYENVRAYCYNCQHYNGHCITRWPWFTVCFIPMIPLATKKYKEVTCYTCRFTQDLRDRPDITPETRPPAGAPAGPAPPPQAYWGPPPQASGEVDIPSPRLGHRRRTINISDSVLVLAYVFLFYYAEGYGGWNFGLVEKRC